LIQRKTKPFDPAAFKDNYVEALEELVERKRAGYAIVSTGEEERRPTGKVINLIEALKRSVGQKPTPSKKPRAAPEPRGRGRSTTVAGRTSKVGAAKKRA
jgi:DNA end-binding protein Ku